MKKRAITVIMFTVLLSGCISSQFAPAEEMKIYDQRVTPESVKVYRTQVPRLEFIEIGAVNATGSDDDLELITELKKKAAENGGDAIIRLEAYPHGMSAAVIRFTERDKIIYH